MSQRTGEARAARKKFATPAAAIASWFLASYRELPWRTNLRRSDRRAGSRAASSLPPRDPYHALVAEAMLQQTQVSRVVGKYLAFVRQFPTVEALASAHEDQVLELWSGLGYYRRARNLHAAAKRVMTDFAGRVPSAVEDLLSLPGVGRYTAGAISSIAFNHPAPIVDGNVARVLMRLAARSGMPDDKSTIAWLWDQASTMVEPSPSGPAPALVNEGLMELGATVCLPAPAAPLCSRCPLESMCAARRQGIQLSIPSPKVRSERREVWCAAAIVLDPAGNVLVQQRHREGMWPGLWQVPTLESADRAPEKRQLAEMLSLPPRAICPVESFEFLATHRRMHFDVWYARAPRGYTFTGGKFVPATDALTLPASRPQSNAFAHAARLARIAPKRLLVRARP